jgi:phenylalanine-4-hydroxylase
MGVFALGTPLVVSLKIMNEPFPVATFMRLTDSLDYEETRFYR